MPNRYRYPEDKFYRLSEEASGNILKRDIAKEILSNYREMQKQRKERDKQLACGNRNAYVWHAQHAIDCRQLALYLISLLRNA